MTEKDHPAQFDASLVPGQAPDELPVEDVQRLVHELRAHQIELEMQNEELRQARQELEASRDRYADLYDFSPVGYITLDEQGMVVEANLTIASLLGVARGDLIGESLTRFIVDEDQDIYYSHHKRLFETQEPWVCELRMVRKGGSWFWARIETAAQACTERSASDGEGRPTSRVTVSDVTEHKRAEGALKASEARYHDLYDNAPAMFVSVDAKTANIVECNQTLADALGYTKEEIVGRPIFDVYTPKSAQYAKENVFPEFAKTGVIEGEELELQRKDGSAIDVLLKVSAVRDAQGNILYSRSSWRDITERKRAGEALRKSEERFRSFMDSATESCFLFDSKLDHVMINQVGLHKFLPPGTRLEDLVGKNILDIVPDIKETGRYYEYLQVIETRVPFKADDMVPHPKFGDVHLNLRAFKVGDGLGIIVADVTERVRAEEALRAAEEIQDVILSTTDVLLAYMDREFNFIAVNQAYADSGHRRREDFVDRNHFELYPHAENQSLFERVVETGEALLILAKPFEHPNQPERGTTWWDWSLIPIKDKSGGVRALVLSLLDVSERMRAVEELRAAEALQYAVIESLDEALHLVDTELVIQLFNRKFSEWSGELDLETDPVGKYIRDAFPFLSDAVIDQYRQVLTTGKALVTQEETTLGEQTIITQARKVPVKTGGQVTGVLTIITDITERVRVEEALRESESRFRTILENSSDLLYKFNLQTNTYDYMSPSIEKMIGISAKEYFEGGLDLATSILHPEDRTKLQEHINHLLEKTVKDDMIPNLEYRSKHRELGYRWFNDRRTVIYDENNVAIAIVGSCRDITERKRAEERIKAALEEREVLLREVHHRVKNNMQSLVHLVDMQIEPNRDPVVVHLLKDFQGRIHAMGMVHEQLYQAQDLAQINFGTYLKDLTYRLYHAFASGRPISLRVDAEDIPISVNKAIPCGMIVNELMMNALKYAFVQDVEYGQEIRVEFGKRGDGYVLVVVDNGVGLPPDLDWRTTESLGLKLVNIWATYQLQGSVRVDNTSGAVFTIEFPK